MNPALVQLIKYGVLGPILAWALWMETESRAMLLTIIREDMRTMEEVKAACEGRHDSRN